MKTEGIIALISSIRDKAHRFIIQQLKERGITDIAPAHGGIFVHLFRNTEMTMGEMAQSIDRDKSTVTALVDKLVALGYVKKERDIADNRVTKIRLTQKGRSLEANFTLISNELLEQAYHGFLEEEKRKIIDLLGRMNKNF
ncbi:MAG: MarR family transcriptional regulator [Deltaproteobacteria bacterium]|nr:MarR family transcriptional regulator [Deltaproteobacteria bacterium]